MSRPVGIIAILLHAFAMGLCGCARQAHPGNPDPQSVAKGNLALCVYVFVDDEFIDRFGPFDGKGRQKVNDWLWEAERQLQLEFPLELRFVGLGRWRLPAGAWDGRVIFEKYAPRAWPSESGADCLIAFTGRKNVQWSGFSEWPRIFVKAQAAEPVDEKTMAMICHEIAHWFGAEDIIDPSFPERSVMNYKDQRYGVVDGRVRWDEANRKRILEGIAALRPR